MELTDSALCHAVAEMAQGLIDADLGGGIVKKRMGLPAAASEVAPERSWPLTGGTDGSSSTGSRKTIEPTSRTMSWKR